MTQRKETTVPSNKSKQHSLAPLTSAELNQIYGGPAGDGCPWCLYRQ